MASHLIKFDNTEEQNAVEQLRKSFSRMWSK